MLKFKLWRLQESLTQEEAAKRLGIGASTLAILESGRLRPTPGQIDNSPDFWPGRRFALRASPRTDRGSP